MKRRRSGRTPPPRRAKKKRAKTRPSLVLAVRVLGREKIEFIPHALDRLVQRRVNRDYVIEAINDPTSTGHPTQLGRHRIRRVFAGSGIVIDVVYEEWRDRIRVITAFPR